MSEELQNSALYLFVFPTYLPRFLELELAPCSDEQVAKVS